MQITPVLFVALCLATACGETVNYDTEEKPKSDAALEGSNPSDDAMAGSPEGNDAGMGQGNGQTTDGQAPNGNNPDGSGGTGPATGTGTGGGTVGIDIDPTTGLPFACVGGNIQSRNSLLVFPEIAAGTTCSFGTAPHLSRKNGFFRAYHTQTQIVDLPQGAILCAFSLKHKAERMRYDDEMFFTVNNKLLLSTKDYSEVMPTDGFFHAFDWDGLVNQTYDSLDSRKVYCAGGAMGMSSCKVPATETEGSIELNFSKDMDKKLADTLRGEQNLRFEWTTTGDNDDSDCRHSPINLEVSLQYVLP